MFAAHPEGPESAEEANLGRTGEEREMQGSQSSKLVNSSFSKRPCLTKCSVGAGQHHQPPASIQTHQSIYIKPDN